MTLPPPQPPDTFPCSPDSSYSHFVVRQYFPTAITTALPVVVTIDDHGFTQGQALRATNFYRYPFASSSGMEQLNNRLFYVGYTTTNTFELYDVSGQPIDGRGYTPYVNKQIAQFCLTGPQLYVINPTYPPPPGIPIFPPV